MAEPQLWLVRHGETAWSRERKHTGRSDIPLTAVGEQAARELLPRLHEVRFDLVLASSLSRAWRTAELAGLVPVAEPLAKEWNYGAFEGLTTAQIQEQRPGWSVWDGPVPDGETLAEVAGRADAVVARVRAETDGRAVLVAHAHFLRVLAARWLGESPELGRHLALDTATVSVLGWDRGSPMILRWNT
ncbi:histidine phosphatase family protein [Spongisporangium articulatum]|uniref:Histidine phosphatase family protein n=1 Tax=Spongisporangium articulatum TaxID=3362603 RepID=A0ABW8AIH0_9ACTN